MSNLSNGNLQQNQQQPQQQQQQQQHQQQQNLDAGAALAVAGAPGGALIMEPGVMPAPGLGVAVGVAQRQRLLLQQPQHLQHHPHHQHHQNPAAEGSGLERGSCLLRYASQNSLDESSQKHIQRPNGKERGTVGQYNNEQHTVRSFDAMNEMRK